MGGSLWPLFRRSRMAGFEVFTEDIGLQVVLLVGDPSSPLGVEAWYVGEPVREYPSLGFSMTVQLPPFSSSGPLTGIVAPRTVLDVDPSSAPFLLTDVQKDTIFFGEFFPIRLGLEPPFAGLPCPPPSTNERPIANAGGIYSSVAGDTIQLDGTASQDPEGGALGFEWYLPQEAIPITSTETSPSVVFDRPGTFTVHLRVTDPEGAISQLGFGAVEAIATVEVAAPPVCDIDRNGQINTADLTLLMAGRGEEVSDFDARDP
ncbi:MAG: PKD domain-containing protein, partial [bacterium]|nr:PKD domain-containing protein [bacterium]